MEERWFLINRRYEDVKKISENCNISNFVSRILLNRDIDDEDKVNRFLYGTLDSFYPSECMLGMEQGVELIVKAIKNKKKIVIYGDYDCDGVTSTVILYNALKNCEANFDYYIPNRESEGYGINKDRIKKLKEEGFEAILTCDNGISAFEEIKLAKELGFEVVITDHHDIPFKEENNCKVEKVPEADVIVNPKQSECTYPFKGLCGAGVALKFAKELYKHFDIDKDKWKELVEFCAIATVCDVVNLVDENRIIVKEGLKNINNSSKLGVKSLIKETGLEGKKITAYHLGFVLGPCINATGRLETAALAVKLLISEDEKEASDLAKELVNLNKIRQDLTLESVEQVTEQIEKNNMHSNKVLVVYNEFIHESIAGIVAGRIKERYNVPTIVLTKGKEMPKGSGRSIEEYNMFEELSKCKEFMEKFGGHPMAAGLSIKEENIDKLKNKLLKNCVLKDEDIIPKVRIDMKLPVEKVEGSIINILEKLEPFGKGNSHPLFGDKFINVKRIWFLGKENNILKFKIKDKSNKYIDGISFSGCDNFKKEIINKYGEDYLKSIIDTSHCDFKMDILYYPQINEFNGVKSIQLNIKSFRII